MKRPIVISIAGFDPTAGAGVMADVKTFEQNNVLGFAVNTANTVQTEDNFSAVNWVESSIVFAQLEVLLKRYKINGIKIGLAPNFNFILNCLSLVEKHQAKQPIIVWDPILTASAGFDFKHNLDELNAVLKKVDYVTPNWNEVKVLSDHEGLEGARKLAIDTKVYLKGGHSKVLGKDYLISKDKEQAFNMKKEGFEKHGSGCVFSSALLSFLVLGYPEKKACLKAKSYIERVLSSNKSKLGYHRL